jgi:hypothetical protein
LFPYRIYIDPMLDAYGPEQLPQIGFDYGLQLVLPLGLLYATLRHLLLDLSFALNHGVVFGAIRAVAAHSGTERISLPCSCGSHAGR